MASKHFTSSTAQAQAQPREPEAQSFGSQMYQYERGKLEIEYWKSILSDCGLLITMLNIFYLCFEILASNVKRRNPNGFESLTNKIENKALKPEATENDGVTSNEHQPHNPYIASASEGNSNKNHFNSKTLTYGNTHKSKAHSKRARNRSLEMVIDDDKADSSPSRSRYRHIMVRYIIPYIFN